MDDANCVYWSRRRDDLDVLSDIIWALPNSVKLLNIFHTILIMDNTYKTNKYRQLLFEIVGMILIDLHLLLHLHICN